MPNVTKDKVEPQLCHSHVCDVCVCVCCYFILHHKENMLSRFSVACRWTSSSRNSLTVLNNMANPQQCPTQAHCRSLGMPAGVGHRQAFPHRAAVDDSCGHYKALMLNVERRTRESSSIPLCIFQSCGACARPWVHRKLRAGIAGAGRVAAPRGTPGAGKACGSSVACGCLAHCRLRRLHTSPRVRLLLAVCCGVVFRKSARPPLCQFAKGRAGVPNEDRVRCEEHEDVKKMIMRSIWQPLWVGKSSMHCGGLTLPLKGPSCVP